MSRVELNFRPEFIPVREEFIWSQNPEQPPVFVRESCETGCFEAVSAFSLAGVVRERRTRVIGEKESLEADKTDDRHLRSLLAGLRAGGQLDFVYTGGLSDRGGECFKWKIMSRARANSRDEAVHGSQQIWRNLGVMFHSLERAYGFSPVTELSELYESQEAVLWKAAIRPLGVAISRDGQRPVGFITQTESINRKEKVVLIPHPSKAESRHFESVAGLLGCHSQVKVVLSFSSVRLSDEQLRAAASALEWLRSGAPKGIRYLSEVRVEEAEVLGGVQHYLEHWFKNPTGYWVSCSVISSGPILPSLITMIGYEVFHGMPVTIKMNMASDGDAPADEEQLELSRPDVLDLRELINGACPLPPVFPSTTTLLDAGVQRYYRPPRLDLPDDGRLLGRINLGSGEREVRFDQAGYHSYIIGATGVGKSTLLRSMITQSIESDEGVALIDPHGDLYQQVLEAIPRRRVKDVVLVDYCDFEHAVGINFLECNGTHKQMQMSFITNEMIKIFDRLYNLRLTGGPMFEQYMRNALLLVMDNDFPGATLMDIPLLFEDKEYRNFLLGKCRNQLVVGFWKRQAEQTVGEMSLHNMAPYVTSKLNQFTSNSLVRPIIGQSRSTVDFRQVMDRGQILLVNLSKGLLSELDVQLLGMLIIGKIFCAGMERAGVPAAERRPFRIFIDEFQNFTTDTVASLLSEARKYKLYLTLAHQNLAQLSTEYARQNVLETVLGNVGSLLLFRLGAVDAQKMEVYTRPELDAEDLQELPDYHVAARLQIGGRLSRPFVFKTLPASANADAADVGVVVQESRRKHTRPTAQVEESLLRRRTSYREWDGRQDVEPAEQPDERGERLSGREKLSPEERARLERLQSLQLSRTRTLDQLKNATKPAHREMLRRALQALETEMEELQ